MAGCDHRSSDCALVLHRERDRGGWGWHWSQDHRESVTRENLRRSSGKAVGKETNGFRSDSITDDEVLLPLSEIERKHILKVLSRTGGNKQAAARILGIDRTTLQRKLERYDVEAANGNTTNGS